MISPHHSHPTKRVRPSDFNEWEYTHGVREWARIGRNMDGSLPQTLPNVDEKYSSCKSCDKKLEGWSNGFLTTWP